MNQAEHDALVALLQWWRGNRPLGWSVEEHWASPAINVAGGTEIVLARAAARVSLIDYQREKPRYNQATLETQHAEA